MTVGSLPEHHAHTKHDRCRVWRHLFGLTLQAESIPSVAGDWVWSGESMGGVRFDDPILHAQDLVHWSMTMLNILPRDHVPSPRPEIQRPISPPSSAATAPVLETYISFLAWKMERLDAQTSIVKRPVIEVPEDEDSMAAAVFDSNDPSSPLHYTAQQTALLLLDFQGFIISQCGDVGPAALAAAVQMRDWACDQGVTVVHSIVDVKAQIPPSTKGAARLTTLLSTLRDDREAVEEPAALAFPQRDNEYIVLKPPGVISGLKSHRAMDLLAQRGIKSLIICGLSTSGAVLRTATAATDEEFVVSVVRDACADPKEGVHEMVLGTVLPNRAHVINAVELMAQWEKAMATLRSAGPGKADD
ncbi:hypothetical protein LTR53_007099 [Teratosphaeriaceae sp. CCFEE 6253]|nr:hypothetical protein LTR53_007099 [Teratosphaeriaceae sp. CCFEE 6253]